MDLSLKPLTKRYSENLKAAFCSEQPNSVTSKKPQTLAPFVAMEMACNLFRQKSQEGRRWTDTALKFYRANISQTLIRPVPDKDFDRNFQGIEKEKALKFDDF